MKTSTLFQLMLLLVAALGHPGLARAQARGPARAAEPVSRSTVRGRVVYADTGNPVRRADVIIKDAATGQAVGGTVTNVKGEFSLKDLPAGRYSLGASAPGLVDSSVNSDSDEGTELLDMAEGLNGLAEVELNGTGGADVVIRARRGGAITGRVTSEDDEPVAGAQLRLFRLRRGQLARVASTWHMLEEERMFLTTDSRGVYRIGGLPAGEYVVRVSESDLGKGASGEDGDAYGDGSLVVSYYPSAASVKEAVPVRVYEGRDTDRVDIRIPERPARRLGGTVTLKRGGGAIIGAEIAVGRKDEGPHLLRWFGPGSARTGTNGRWEVAGVPDGEYVLNVKSVVAVVTNEAGDIRSVRVMPVRREVTVSGADITDLKFEMEEGARVAGTLSVEGGRDLPDGVRIEAVRDGEVVEWDFIGEGGRFELNAVPAGEVRLRVTEFPGDGFYLKSLAWNQFDLTREPLRVGQGSAVEGVRAVLSADVATLGGHALSRRDAATPLAHALVVLVPADERLRRAGGRPRAVRADAKGRFRIAAGPGEYFVVAFPERAALTQRISVDEEYVRRSRATLTRVTLKAGEGASGLKVLGGEE